MDAEMFNLTWDSFQISTKETFKSLVNEEEFMDNTLACADDTQLKAHKFILSACSPFFKNILLKNPHPSPLIYISGVSSRDLQAILNFMYLGETNVEQSHLESFMTSCNIIKVRGLTAPDVKEEQLNVNNKEVDKENLPVKNSSSKKHIEKVVIVEKNAKNLSKILPALFKSLSLNL